MEHVPPLHPNVLERKEDVYVGNERELKVQNRVEDVRLLEKCECVGTAA